MSRLVWQIPANRPTDALVEVRPLIADGEMSTIQKQAT